MGSVCVTSLRTCGALRAFAPLLVATVLCCSGADTYGQLPDKRFIEAADQAFSKGDLKGAIDQLGHALNVNPSNLEAFVARGLIYLRMGVHDLAERDLKSA